MQQLPGLLPIGTIYVRLGVHKTRPLGAGTHDLRCVACMKLQLTRRNFLELEQVIESGYDDTNTGRLQLDRSDADAQRQNHRHRHIDEGNILMATTRISPVE